ncbi:MAG: ABC transporter permease [Fibrobacteres bacterium]|jgi:putative ABC transport system permease protein|nr:ABC transporter permease [Fibrobacterota bacterium]
MKFSVRSVWIGVQASRLEMVSNRFRSVLTLAGVALAIGVVTVMTAFQTGTQKYMKTLVADMGGVGRVGLRAQPANTPAEEALFARSQGVRLADADSMNRPQSIALRASRVAQANLGISYQGRTRATQVRGVDAKALMEDEKALIESGRFPIKPEYDRGERVAVVGWKVAELLRQIRQEKGWALRQGGGLAVGDDSLSGVVIDIAGVPYTIVGVFTRQFKRWDVPGWWIYVPIRSLLRDFTGPNPGVEWMNLVVDADNAEATLDGPLTELVKSLHRGAQDFAFRLFDFIGEYSVMMNNLRIVFWLISCIALLVGGVNILNVMLSTLAERVQEIGVRKALGATPAQIFLQLLVESVTLSLVGGIVGTGLGLPILLFRPAIEKATGGIVPELPPSDFLWIFGLTVLMGVASGLYPALKAARLSPMEALSYE